MVFCRNVATLVWRTLYLQAVRRNYIYTALELLAIAYFYHGAREQYIKPTPLVPPMPLPLENVSFDQVTAVVYGPSTGYTDSLMEPVIDMVTQPRQQNTSAAGKEVSAGSNSTIVVRKVGSADDVRPACHALVNVTKEAPKDRRGPSTPKTSPLCVAFHGNAVSGSGPELKLDLMLYTDSYFKFPKTFKLGEELSIQDRWYPAIIFDHFIKESHLALQRKQQKKNDTLPKVTVEPLPDWNLENAGSGPYRIALFQPVLYTFTVVLMLRLQSLTYEFSSGLADYQQIMGLDERQFFVGHFTSMMLMLTVENAIAISLLSIPDKNGLSTFNNVDVSLVFTCFTLCGIGVVLLAIVLACIFPSGGRLTTAVVVVLLVAVQYAVPSGMNSSLGSYLIITRLSKLLSAIMPPLGLIETLRIMFIAQDYEDGADWSLVSRRVLEKDNVTILEIWLVMLASDVGFVVIGWYLSKTLPWSSDNPQMPYFFLLPSYWFPREAVTEAGKQAKDPMRFEKMPPEAKPLIVTHDLTKVFGSNIALDGVDLVMYEKTCTVLLGHNGAGKTTLMSVLTGIRSPTRGVAHVAGNDVVLNRRLVRHDVSLCPQFDIFFNDLTVWENLVYFVTLKGMPKSQLQENLTATLKSVNLLDKIDSLPSALSGGMKRRLSLAITLASRPKLLILDEPTTGLDPEVRRSVWDVLQAIDKSETSMLLSTHDMEEADAMADQIIIMACGKVVCSGSTAFLKKSCNVGYVLTITKASSKFNLAGVMAIVKQAAPEAELDDDKQDDVRISLKTLECKTFAPMFEALEKSQKTLGAGNIGVNVASMKDVYIKINLDWVPGVHSEQGQLNEDAVAVAGRAVKREPRLSRHLYAISAKRMTSFARSWGSPALGVLLSVGLLALMAPFLSDKGALESKLENEQDTTTKETFVPIDPSNLGGDYPSTLLLGEGDATSAASQQFRLIAEAVGSRLLVFKDVDEGARELARNGFSDYVHTVAGGAVYGVEQVRVLFNPTNMWSQALLLSMVHQAQLRADSGRTTATLASSYRFVAFPNTDTSSKNISLTGNIFAIWVLWMFIVTGSLGLLVSNFAVQPAVERISCARDVQLMSGVSGTHYVLCHLIIDFAVYAAMLVPWMGVLAALASYTPLTLVYIAVILGIYGPVFILLDYIIAEHVTTSASASFRVILMFSIGGFLSFMLYILAVAYVSVSSRYVFLLFPPFGVTDTIALAVDMRTRAYRCGMADSSQEKVGNASRHSGLSAAEQYGLVDQQTHLRECDLLPTTFFDFSEHGLMRNIVLVVIEAVLLFAYVAYVHSGRSYWPKRRKAAAEDAGLDADVSEEKRNVDHLCQTGDFSGHTMVAQNVHKFYGDFHAVRGINVALRPAECFGLLGVNGAGKTTTFQMLAGFSELSDGEAYAENLKVTANPREWQSRIGYCFQIDGLLDTLNAYEFLYLVGRLRGIADEDLRTIVDSLISLTDLTEYAHRRCGSYSGGNKRKLSVAAALLGLPPLVFLDEPYAGVDVVARDKIFKGVDRVKKLSKSTIVLTSHSMEECEFSCDRLCIMVAGQMKCLGSLQHLRNKFGKGYRFEFMLKHGADNDPVKFVADVLELFPGIRVVETHENVCVFILDNKLPWSTIFTKVALLDENFALEHILIGENTLEQIFIAFAKQEEMKSTIVQSATNGELS